MLTTIIGTLVLIAALLAMALMLVCSIDAALRREYQKHAMKAAREQYRKWCAQTPVQVESHLTFICGKGYEKEMNR